MRNFKGIELPVNSVIVIALAIFVLLMLAMFFGNSSDELSSIDAQTAYTRGCSVLASTYNCDADAVTEIKTTLTEGGDNVDLLTACRRHLNDAGMSAEKCAASCSGCKSSGMTVFAGDICSGDDACDSSYTDGWKCVTDCNGDGGYCCPEGKKWDGSACIAESSCSTELAVGDKCSSATDSECVSPNQCVEEQTAGTGNTLVGTGEYYCCASGDTMYTGGSCS